MPADIIELDDYRQHLEGLAICMECGYEWAAAAPIGTVHLECPDCGRMHGLLKNAVEPQEGQDHFSCRCGGTLFYALVQGLIMCRKCGMVGNPWDA